MSLSNYIYISLEETNLKILSVSVMRIYVKLLVHMTNIELQSVPLVLYLVMSKNKTRNIYRADF